MRAPRRRVLQVVLVLLLWALLGAADLGGVRAGYRLAWLGLAALILFAAWGLDAFVPALGRTAVVRGPRTSQGPPRVALTFDDGPSEDTPAVLAALAQSGVPATFFFLGRHIERHPGIAVAVVRAGHAVGNHTYSHPNLAVRGERSVARELDRTDALLAVIGAPRPSLVRTPRGFQGPIVRRVLRRRGQRLIAWTRGAWDSERRTPEQIAAAATTSPRDGDILLLHDGAAGTRWASRAATAAALPLIVDVYRKRGFRFVTVPELLRPEPGTQVQRLA